MSKNNAVAEELKEYDRFNKFDTAYLCLATNIDKDKGEESKEIDLSYKRRLVKNLLSQAGNMFLTQDTLGSTVMQI
jgi:hypothetical protein